ncbi:TPA: CbrC family protein [Clostridioides difficile]|nr:CbrC family protein [Clostridioides difficile]EGT3758768.1 CbrC family protein [Clostridioides difficile]EGT3766830.1 CbrC family protein [Clostridioides difficile]EGT4111541.1 CbrC family protein [Clostridioides difficile]EGT4517108.1 hypothetical protein [Clostridioides difficile]EGT4573886.1 hypothetical protein [Clostridioides difficile]
MRLFGKLKGVKAKNLCPQFRYQPFIYENGCVEWGKDICQCCGKKVNKYINMIYSEQEVDCICLECIANGKASKKFNGTFIQDVEKVIDDEEKTKELFERTPGYVSWQGEYWLTCCDDYCAYIGTVGIKELQEMGIVEEALAEYENRNERYENIRENLTKNGSLCGYLFQCLHCGKYRLWVDAD